LQIAALTDPASCGFILPIPRASSGRRASSDPDRAAVSFLRDSFWTFLIQAAGALVQLVIGVVLARVLLAEGRGVYWSS
jgi:hypothetical protein